MRRRKYAQGTSGIIPMPIEMPYDNTKEQFIQQAAGVGVGAGLTALGIPAPLAMTLGQGASGLLLGEEFMGMKGLDLLGAGKKADEKHASFKRNYDRVNASNRMGYTDPMVTAANGMLVDAPKPIEVEKDELIFDKNFRLKADFKDGNTHEQGGEQYNAAEGDIIFPAKMRKKVEAAYKANDIIRLRTYQAQLPPDNGQGTFDDGVRGIKRKGSYRLRSETPMPNKMYGYGDPLLPLTPDNYMFMERNRLDQSAGVPPYLEYDRSNKATADNFPIIPKGGGYVPPVPAPFDYVPPVDPATLPRESAAPYYQEYNMSLPDSEAYMPTLDGTTSFDRADMNSPRFINVKEGAGFNGAMDIGKQTLDSMGAFKRGIENIVPPLGANAEVGGMPQDEKSPLINKDKAKDVMNRLGDRGFWNTAATYAPTIYDLSTALTQEAFEEIPMQFNPRYMAYTDRSESVRNQSRQMRDMGIANAANLSGGNINNVRANAAQSQGAMIQSMRSIDQQESQRYDTIQSMNAQLANNMMGMQAQENIRAQTATMQNQAKRKELITTGLENLSQGVQMDMLNNKKDAMMREQMNNQLKADIIRTNALNSMGLYEAEVDENGVATGNFVLSNKRLAERLGLPGYYQDETATPKSTKSYRRRGARNGAKVNGMTTVEG